MTGTQVLRSTAHRGAHGHFSARDLRRSVVLLLAAAVILLMALLMKDAGAIAGSLELSGQASAVLVVAIDAVAAATMLAVPSVARRLVVPRSRR